jgi:nicotinate-nucleotide adenylyltransferase
MRIAFFGGSFDPPHRGHVAIAKAAADRLALDRLLVAPVGRQPLKTGWSQSDYEERFEMVSLAFAGDARFEASRLDAPLPDGQHNYTYDTLAGLKYIVHKVHPDSQLFCLLGADSFHTLAHWHRSAELILLCDWIVAARPGYSLQEIESRLPTGVHASGQVTQHDLVEIGLEADNGLRSRLYVLTDLEEDVSATALRHALASGDAQASDAMLAPGVAAYIRRHGLYQAID